MANFIPSRDLDFVEWLDNFLSLTSVSPGTVGLTAGEITQITNARDDFRGTLTDLNAARSALESASTAKDTSRATTEALVRQVVRKVQVTSSVTAATRASLRINVRDSTPTTSQPVAPSQLTVTGDANGSHRLVWSRNGNTVGAQFVIEARIGGSTEWSQVDVVTTIKYVHHNQKPGVPVIYRVRARRRRELSEPSNEAGLYL